MLQACLRAYSHANNKNAHYYTIHTVFILINVYVPIKAHHPPPPLFENKTQDHVGYIIIINFSLVISEGIIIKLTPLE